VHSDGKHRYDQHDTMGVKGWAHEGVPEVVRDFCPRERVTSLHITLVSEEIGFFEDEVVEVLVGEVVEVLVEGSMVVRKVVVDCIAGTVVGIVVDNMGQAFEVVVVDSLDFVELGYEVICWQYMGGLGKLAEVLHGPPCRPLERSFYCNCSQTSWHHWTNYRMNHLPKQLMSYLP